MPFDLRRSSFRLQAVFSACVCVAIAMAFSGMSTEITEAFPEVANFVRESSPSGTTFKRNEMRKTYVKSVEKNKL